MAQLGSLLDPPADASQINKLEKGQRELTIAWMKRLARALGCEPQDLVGYTVPLVGHVGAGARIVNDGDPQLGSAIDVVPNPPLGGSGLIALRVTGDSMYPRYDDGDLIYARREHNSIDKDCLQRECIVKLRNGEIYLKKLHKGPQPGRYILRAHNAPDIEDAEIDWALPVLWHKPA